MKTFKDLILDDLRNWFNPNHPEGGWKRINSKGEAIGPCAREPGEPKPKCMSNEKRAKLSKKERAAAVRAKRKHDPNPERKGEPINVSNFGKGKISEEMENLEEKNVPTSPEKWARAKALAKQKFDVYPSAYANGWAAKKYKEMGGGWKSVDEAVKDEFDVGEYDQEGDMAKSDLRSIIVNAKKLHDMMEDSDNLPEWVQSKITKAEDYISTVANYMTAEMNEEVEQIDELSTDTLKSYSTKATGQIIDKNTDKKTKEKRHQGLGKVLPKLHSNSDKMFKVQYKEEVELEEGMMKRMATDKEEDERLSKPPFDKPYKTVKNIIKDKSGAKHGPMSRARDLARQGSRKVAIVREAAEKAKKKVKEKKVSDDTFQSEPELGTTLTKNY